MTYAIASGIHRRPSCAAEVPGVSVNVYGTRETPPTHEDIGKAAGLIFAAAEAALKIDPFAKFEWRVTGNRNGWTLLGFDRVRCNRYESHELVCIVSSGDVLVGGPLWRSRANDVARAMYDVIKAGTFGPDSGRHSTPYKVVHERS